jgi:membrane-bound inhibitor of C-type lysozyme
MKSTPFHAAALVVAGLAIALGSGSAYAAGKEKMQKHAPAKAEAKPLAPASPEQIDAAEKTLYGDYACEFKQSLHVSMNPKTPGYVDVLFNKKTYTMTPVMSSTGALRLEDVTGRTLVVQIATKSMMLDVKVGQRMVDECIHPTQATNKPS